MHSQCDTNVDGLVDCQMLVASLVFFAVRCQSTDNESSLEGDGRKASVINQLVAAGLCN